MITLDGTVEGDISINDDGTLHYRYTLGATLSEGDAVPAAKGTWLAMAPQVVGGRAKGSITVDANGSRSGLLASDDDFGIPAVSLTGRATVGTDFDKYFPKSEVVKIRPFVNVRGTIETLQPLGMSVNGELKPLHVLWENSFRISGGVKAEVDVSGLLPAVRPLKAALKTIGGDAKIVGKRRVEPGYVTRRRQKSRSVPEIFLVLPEEEVTDPMGSVDLIERAKRIAAANPRGLDFADPKQLEPQLLALSAEFCPQTRKDRERIHTASVGITAGIEASLDATLAAESLEGQIFTENFEDDQDDSWEFSVNPHGDNPYITGVKGYITVDLTAKGRLLFLEGRKKFTLNKFLVDRPFNTYEVFSVTAIDTSESTVSILNSPRADLIGMEPHLVGNAFPVARYAAASGSSAQALAFLDPDSTSSTMKLQIALQTSPPAWATPIEVASAAGIVGVAVHPLSGGGWMAVWSEVMAPDMSEISPPTTIKFATTADGTTWTTPATIGATGGTATELRLLPMPGGDLGLVYQETERGLVSKIIDLEAFLYSSGSWGPQQILFDDLFLTAFDAAGSGFAGTGPAQIMGITDIGGLVAVGWDGSAVGATAGLDAASTGSQARITGGPADSFVVVYEQPNGMLGLFYKLGSDPWSTLSSINIGVQPASIAVTAADDGTEVSYAAAWVSRDGSRDVGIAWFDDTGSVLTGPSEIASGSPGTYDELQLVPIPGALAADVIALYRDGTEVSGGVRTAHLWYDIDRPASSRPRGRLDGRLGRTADRR